MDLFNSFVFKFIYIFHVVYTDVFVKSNVLSNS